MDELSNVLAVVQQPGVIAFQSQKLGEVGEGKVRIKIYSSAICGSDLHIFKGNHPSVQLPVTIGHELAGEIVDLGTGCSKFHVGQAVTIEPVVTCGKCPACLSGNYGYCENISFTYRNGDGGMAKYIDVFEKNVYLLPKGMTYDEGSLIEPLSVATHAVRRASISLGDKVVVFGAGAIGLFVAALARKNGAAEVVVVDYSQNRLNLSLELGATRVVNPSSESVDEVINTISSGSGMDKAFECVGKQDTFVQAMMSVRKNGLVTIVGIFEDQQITIPAGRFITHEIHVQGAQGYCWDFPIALHFANEIPLQKLITHRFPLKDLQRAFETAFDRSKNSVKIVIHPWEE
jgi:2-desacetyl-2-hydroxyethyl bacteriochlorophyllide A dehydrogenase